MAKVIDGKSLADSLFAELKEKLTSINQKNASFQPTLAIVQVGDKSDSNVYVKAKQKCAAELGFETKHTKLGKETNEATLKGEIEKLNADKSIDAIMVLLPFQCTNTIDTDTIINCVEPSKDVDGLTRANVNMLKNGELDKAMIPCAAAACLHMVQKGTEMHNYTAGKKVVMVGGSRIVGQPTVALFKCHNASTKLCDIETQDLQSQCLSADILVVAIGQPEFIKGNMIKSGAVVLDCGVNVRERPERGRAFVGDVDFEAAKEVASYISPVPGGVGPVTVAMLMKNTLELAIRNKLK